MHERRARQRQRVLKEAKVLMDDLVSVNCTLRDISDCGAGLELENPICLLPDFHLRIVSADLTLPVTAVWQRGLNAGIRFTDGDAARITRSTRQTA